VSAPSSVSLQERAVHDPPLAAAYQPGSLEDFDRLYRDNYAPVLRMLVGVLRDRPAAEECTQDAFVRALRAWPKWRPDAPAEAWLHRIALNVAISYRRREGLRTLAQVLSRFGSSRATTGADDPGESSELLTALRRLPPRQSAVLVLRFNHGYSNRDIAAALGVAESTIASRLAAAKLGLHRQLEAGAQVPEAQGR
jgi:RNA polymerase sigma-70 factor, ECF subfamily